MRKNSILSKNKLTKYSALSTALLGLTNVAGQIIYTDVDPDEVLSNATYGIDMDGDGTTEFTASAASSVAKIFAPNNANQFIGYSGGFYAYPYALELNDPISGTNPNFVTSFTVGTLNYSSCSFSYSAWCGVTDKYVGIRFELNGNTHYGWIRMDVSASGDEIKVKDFAYNSISDESILAGQGMDLNTIEKQLNTTLIQHYVTKDNVLIIKSKSKISTVTIYNTLGQRVLESNSKTRININDLESGAYIANVLTENNIESFKFIK